MNSRGLSLTAFENFKASIVKYMKDEKHDKKYTTNYGQTTSHFSCILQQRLMHVGLICLRKIDDTGLIKPMITLRIQVFPFFQQIFIFKSSTNNLHIHKITGTLLRLISFMLLHHKRIMVRQKFCAWKNCYVKLFDSTRRQL